MPSMTEGTQPDQEALAKFHDDVAYWDGAQARFLKAWKRGGELLRSCGANSMADIVGNLDRDHRQVLTDLTMNYTGW